MSNDGDYYYDDWHPLHDDGDDDNHNHFSSKIGKKRKEKKSSPSDPPEGLDDLVVMGTKCHIHRNDKLATHLHDEKHLVNYFEEQQQEKKMSNGDDDDNDDDVFRTTEEKATHEEALWIDRYDVRALLDSYDSFPIGGDETNRGEKDEKNYDTFVEDGVEDDEILNFERYGALPEYVELFVKQKENVDAESNVDVDCLKSSESLKKNESVDQKEAPFEMGSEELTFIPAGMVMPETVRQNRVIQMTAARSVEGPQFEVLLKVKQAQNPDFAFLKPNHDLYPYYVLLKQREVMKRQQNDDDGNENDGEDEVSQEEQKVGLIDYASSSEGDDDAPRGVTGLVGIYSSSSDENDDDNERHSSKKIRTVDNSFECQGNAPSAPNDVSSDKQCSPRSSPSLDERRAKRLKRARMLKDQFVLKMSD